MADKPGAKVAVVDNVAFADAVTKSKVSPWTKRMFLLYAICFVGTLNSCINGYDGSLMSSINAMDSYKKQFNMKPTGAATGFVFAIYTIGNIVGAFVAGPLTDTWGRRWGMLFGAAIIVIGTCIQAPASNMAQFKGGRFVLGFGVAISATAGPSYVAEMAHPKYRGVITGIYNSFWFIGSIPASAITYATNRSYGEDPMAWRLPLWIQMTFSGVVVLFSLFLPETPRWLMANDRHEEALAVLTRYHGEGDRESPIVQLSYREMQEQIRHDGSDKRWWDYRELFNSRAARWRSTMVVSMSFFGQWSGNAAISYFMPVMLALVGIKDSDTQLKLNMIIAIISFVGASIGSTLVDKVGRRRMLFGASCLFVVWFILVTALSASYGKENNTNKSGANASIAFIYIFGFTFSVAFTPFQALYPVECLNFETRAKGMSLYGFCVGLASFFNQYVTPIGLGDAGWKFYFLYIAWDTFQALFIYLFYVETKGRTLEELNEIFEAPNPRNESIKRKKVALVAGEGIAEVLDESSSNHAVDSEK